MLSPAETGEIQTETATRTPVIIAAFLGCIEPVDETAVVDGAKIVQIPRFHRTDVFHRGIFAHIQVIDVLNSAGQGIRFFRQ